ncbi:Cell division protein ftsZ [Bacteroidales bacterium CF]|nr:Cell division protein ftsZ [Bacteroidales bacterium CF]NCB97212.1 cell division protein FtsZ [Bacteroidia bacterium]
MKEYLPLDWESNNSIIKVIGVGGGGCNAVNEMFRQGIKNVDFMICNTDTQALAISPVVDKLQLGNVITRGLGAGCNPEQGKKAAEESIELIKEKLQGLTEMVFLTAGMGGGTGTGATPVIAKVAKEMGLLTVAVVTLPFRDEGSEFMKRAVLGIRELEKYVDCLLIIDNQKLYKIFGDLTIFEAFPKADTVLSTAVKGIAEIITRPGFINVDFADVRMVMNNSGMALMGSGSAEGDNRAIRAVEEAFSSPLLNDFDLTTARNVLVNITSGKEKGLTMAELSQIMEYVKEYTGNNPEHFKRGVVCDESMGEAISVTIVATGFDMNSLPQISSDGGKLVESVVLGTDSVISQQTPSLDNPDGVELNLPEQPVRRQTYTPSVKKEITAPTPLPSEKRVKPTLILEEGDNIKELESQPAYIRKQMKMNNPSNVSVGQDSREGSTFKLEEIDGKHQINPDNSYIHQTQD